jgi:hypothetical protein
MQNHNCAEQNAKIPTDGGGVIIFYEIHLQARMKCEFLAALFAFAFAHIALYVH